MIPFHVDKISCHPQICPRTGILGYRLGMVPAVSVMIEWGRALENSLFPPSCTLPLSLRYIGYLANTQLAIAQNPNLNRKSFEGDAILVYIFQLSPGRQSNLPTLVVQTQSCAWLFFLLTATWALGRELSYVAPKPRAARVKGS